MRHPQFRLQSPFLEPEFVEVDHLRIGLAVFLFEPMVETRGD